MKLNSIVSLVFCLGVVFNLHGQILPAAFGVATPSRPLANPIITSGLVLYLDAGNTASYAGSGTTWTDLSSSGNNGTLTNGPTYSSSNGGSIVFDGSNDIVSSFSTQISGTGSKTISSWIKLNTTSRAGIAGTRSLAEWGWGFTANRSGVGTLDFYDTQGSSLSAAAGLGTNIWYHVTVTFDDSRIVTLYVNGSQVAISSTPFAALNASTFNGVIGNEDEYTNPFYHPFRGNIAQVAIYNRALTAAEVLQNYNALSPRFGDVTNPTTGKIWMDRNLGASQVATSSTDTNAYGDLYQWGRGTDGHQLRSAPSTSTVSSSVTPGNNLYIINRSFPYDWISPQNANLWQGASGVNNPCPSGFRVPTEAEWAAEVATWSSGQNATGAFASPLKLPLAGYRYTHTDALTNVGTIGHYWTSTVSDPNYSYAFDISSSNAVRSIYGRVDARSVRCIQN
jgi:hypothetical protein